MFLNPKTKLMFTWSISHVVKLSLVQKIAIYMISDALLIKKFAERIVLLFCFASWMLVGWQVKSQKRYIRV